MRSARSGLSVCRRYQQPEPHRSSAVMDYDDPRFSNYVNGLVSRVERVGSLQAVAGMSERELERWIAACSAMVARPARASSARRYWRQLLKDARVEHARRKGLR